MGDLYRLTGDGALLEFRRRRDELFKAHPQSPIAAPERDAFAGLRYFEPDPRFRVAGRLRDASDPEGVVEIDTGGEDGIIRYRRAGLLTFTLLGAPCALTVYGLVGYAAGLFLPFRDATSGAETYGGGRYLFDTAKNTDALCLEIEPGSTEVTIDFNYAYNPSCAYDVRWACPLAPRENWLSIPVRAGEMLYRP